MRLVSKFQIVVMETKLSLKNGNSFFKNKIFRTWKYLILSHIVHTGCLSL